MRRPIILQSAFRGGVRKTHGPDDSDSRDHARVSASMASGLRKATRSRFGLPTIGSVDRPGVSGQARARRSRHCGCGQGFRHHAPACRLSSGNACCAAWPRASPSARKNLPTPWRRRQESRSKLRARKSSEHLHFHGGGRRKYAHLWRVSSAGLAGIYGRALGDCTPLSAGPDCGHHSI